MKVDYKITNIPVYLKGDDPNKVYAIGSAQIDEKGEIDIEINPTKGRAPNGEWKQQLKDGIGVGLEIGLIVGREIPEKESKVVPPTEPGWYGYSHGSNLMVFYLDSLKQWYAHGVGAGANECTWSYIEDVGNSNNLGKRWDLVPLVPSKS